MTKKKIEKKESALIEGKIDSKLINSFDGELENLSEEEAAAAKEAIKKIRDKKELYSQLIKSFYNDAQLIIDAFTKWKKADFTQGEAEILKEDLFGQMYGQIKPLNEVVFELLNSKLEELIDNHNDDIAEYDNYGYRMQTNDDLDSEDSIFKEVHSFIKKESDKLKSAKKKITKKK